MWSKDANLEDVAQREKWRGFVRNVPASVTGNAGAAIAYAWIYWAATENGTVFSWLIAVLAVNALRIWLLRRHGRDAARRGRRAARVRAAFLVISAVAGGLWGFGFLLLALDADLTLKSLSAAFALALAVGAITTMGTLLPAFFSFLGLMFIPLAAIFLLGTSMIEVVTGLSILLVAAIVARATVTLNRKVIGLYLSHRANRRLVHDLAIERDRAQAAARAKSEFLATMSHEIRTPMNGVLGMGELLSRTPLNDTQQHYVETLRRSGRLLLDLINNVLDVSKIDSGKFALAPEPFDIARTMATLESMFTPRAREKGLEFRIDIMPEAAGVIEGDSTRVQQILVNLIGNAIKFTDTGEVRVQVALTSGDAATPWLTFSVQDTGPGIPPAKQDAIFEAFEQVAHAQARIQGGTGLGLNISQKLAHLMGGWIDLESTPGQGSRFRFTLPLPAAPAPPCAAATPAAGEPDAATLPSDGPPLRVLLAEDNTVNQEVIGQLLRDVGVQVSIVADGEAACTAVLQDPDAYDLVFMDCDLPVLDGFAATRRIRAEGIDTAHLPILALTAGVMPGDKDRCLEAGMNGYLAKPVSGAELAATLRAQLGGDKDAGPARTPCAPTDGATTTGAEEPDAASEHGTDSPLDWATVARLQALPGRKGRTFLSDLTERFIAAAEDQAARMQEAADDNDADTLQRIAHSLKSSSASMGATTLSRQCREIESAAAQERLSAAAAHLPDLQAELATVRDALRALDRTPANAEADPANIETSG